MGGIRFRTIIVFAVILVLVGAVVLFSEAAWVMRAGDFRHAGGSKNLALALKMYANNGYYPPLSARPGYLMFEMDKMYPTHLSTPLFLLSPADPMRREYQDSGLTPAFCFENSSYFYLGYKVWDDETVKAFAEAYTRRLEEGTGFETDLPVDAPIERLTRLDDAPQRHSMVPSEEAGHPRWEFLNHPTSAVPCLIERPHPYPGPFGLHLLVPIALSKPTMGGMVAYQDGHTEFIPYPGKWPMTEKTISVLTELAELN